MPESSTRLTLSAWIKSFLLARRAEGRTSQTLEMYRADLAQFAAYCTERHLTAVDDISAGLLREYLLQQAARLSPSTVSQHYRVLRAFLRWYADEAGGEDWANPIAKVKIPTVDLPPLAPVAAEDITRILAACTGRQGKRDRAAILVLADVGLRAGELCRLRLADFDQCTGSLVISQSKSRKARTVYLGRKARQAVRAHLRERGDKPGALFLSDDPRRADGTFTVGGLRDMVQRRARQADVTPVPKVHAFRRSAALAMFRAGADLLTISRVLGHRGLTLLERYVRQDADDLRAAAERFSPGDRL